ncbi:putative integral membrane protein [Babesia bovis T2Bo]|uniref:Uncharacterized protein n=1 Tax=Babesia bovis TaxID=5865 RepID=A7AV55_BABBO|nr:putative integral membrane protein [Babesia bovis T2Bo]EDO05681.1 putative integral membrane protein [Babesia bovis T2Bo]|eukprot:XP_001609249.1 hypothetical protein [Babesia bovis T2Bo]
MTEGNLMFIGYVDIKTCVVMASYPKDAAKGSVGVVQDALKSVCSNAINTANDKSIKKLKLDYQTIYYKSDEKAETAVVVMIFEEEYPERLAFTLIQEIWRDVHTAPPRELDDDGIPTSLQSHLGTHMMRIFKRYDKVVEVDHTLRAQMHVDDATCNVEDAMKKIIGSCGSLQELRVKSLNLKNKTVVIILYIIVNVIIISLYIAIPKLMNTKVTGINTNDHSNGNHNSTDNNHTITDSNPDKNNNNN